MSVLQRKAQAGKQEHQARSMTVPKSLRVGLAKVANEMLDLALVVIGATQEKCNGSTLEELIEEPDLLVLLDGPDGDMGGAVLGPGLVSALVQHQTMGRITGQTGEGRVLTATDAALCAPLIDAVFRKSNGLLETDQDRQLLQQFRFGARSENKRLFALALGEPEYHLIRLTIDIAAGSMQSTLSFILPVRKGRADALDHGQNPDCEARSKNLWPTVMGLRAELAAVLCEVKIPLSQLSVLAPGQVLDIPPEAFDEVNLLSVEGSRIALGSLGQVDGQRALMILDPTSSREVGGAADDAIMADDVGHMPDLPSLETDALPDVLTPEDIPLPDLPDLTEVAEIAVPEGDALSEEMAPLDLPDLPDLPELDLDLPDLDDLPKLNIA